MSTDYNAISDGGADGYGNGPYGYGQGYQGSNFGGAQLPGAIGGGAQLPGGVGGAQPPVSVTGGGMTPGEGLTARRMQPGGHPGASAAQGGSLKPILSQMLGLGGPQQPTGQRHGLGGQQRRPGMGGPGRPISGFGPRPTMPLPMPRPNPAPAPAPGGGTIRGSQGRAPVSGPRRRQGTI